MFTSQEAFLSAAARFGLVLDANLLIVYITGHKNSDRIGHTNVTEGYSREDYEMIKYFVDRSLNKKIITTPYVVSEVVHLMGVEPGRIKRGREDNKPEFFDKAIDVLKYANEFKGTSVRDMVNRHGEKTLLRFGIPDVSLVEAVNSKSAFLSSDQQLCDAMVARGMPAMYFGRARVCYGKLSLDNILNR